MYADPLLVIIPDQLSALVAKGEIQPRYYNPGNLFQRVHILMTNADQADPEAVRPMVGDAEVVLHTLPEDYRPLLEPDRGTRWRMFDAWARAGVEMAAAIRPALVRCHGADFNVVIARAIKRALGIPYVVSLHTNPDHSPCRRFPSLDPQQILVNRTVEDMERTCLSEADLVMPVYRSILPYLARLGAFPTEICYNVLNDETLRRKTGYRLGRPVRLLWVGRLYSDKNPDCILRALVDLPEVHYTLVGDGPLCEPMAALADALGIGGRVTFLPSVPNTQLCGMLADFDLFVVHTEAWECNKSVLEALLAGLPVVLNRRVGQPVPELTSDIVHLVENTADSYWQALRHLIDDDAAREGLGRRGADRAHREWAPAIAEARYINIYRRLVDGRRTS